MKLFQGALVFMLSMGLAAAAAADLGPSQLASAVAGQQRLIDQSPGDASLYNDLGNLLYLQNEIVLSEDAYRQALQLDSESIAARYNLALLLQQTERPRRAETEYRKVLKRDPSHAWSHYQLGVVLALRGRRAAAIRSYAEAMRLNPRMTDPAFNQHIVENSLASAAVLSAYSDLSSAALASRVYANPAEVTSLLVAAQQGKKTPERKIRKKRRRQERREKTQEADS